MKNILITLLSVIVIISCSGSPEENLVSYNGLTMGTTYSIKVLKDPLAEVDLNNLQERIDSVLSEVNREMSTYIDTSEISLFNKSESMDCFPVSYDLAFVVYEAIKVSEYSNGAFDITVGPLVNLWGFGPELKTIDLPDEKAITDAKTKVGYKFISSDLETNCLKKTNPDVYCDLSAIAKGFGVDKVGLFLESLGIHNYLVEIGGEVRTLGANHLGIPWRVGVSTPDNDTGIQKVVGLSDFSMATSGDYRNYFEEEGVRYSHTIDPRTGRPITHKLASVTIVHKSCMMADALATAIDVLGPEAGMELANKLSVPAYTIVRKEGEGFDEFMNEAFKKLLIQTE